MRGDSSSGYIGRKKGWDALLYLSTELGLVFYSFIIWIDWLRFCPFVFFSMVWLPLSSIYSNGWKHLPTWMITGNWHSRRGFTEKHTEEQNTAFSTMSKSIIIYGKNTSPFFLFFTSETPLFFSFISFSTIHVLFVMLWREERESVCVGVGCSFWSDMLLLPPALFSSWLAILVQYCALSCSSPPFHDNVIIILHTHEPTI